MGDLLPQALAQAVLSHSDHPHGDETESGYASLACAGGNPALEEKRGLGTQWHQPQCLWPLRVHLVCTGSVPSSSLSSPLAV